MPTENVTELNLTPQSACPIIKVIAAESDKVFFTIHAEERMEQRGITRTQVLRCLKSGKINEGPARNTKGDWEFRMDIFSAGEVINVVAALAHNRQGNRIVIITTYK